MSGPRNTLLDLNNHLFEQLERLNDVEDDRLKDEIERARAVTGIAKSVVDTGKLVLDAEKFSDDRFNPEKPIPRMLGVSQNEQGPKK